MTKCFGEVQVEAQPRSSSTVTIRRATRQNRGREGGRPKTAAWWRSAPHSPSGVRVQRAEFLAGVRSGRLQLRRGAACAGNGPQLDGADQPGKGLGSAGSGATSTEQWFAHPIQGLCPEPPAVRSLNYFQAHAETCVLLSLLVSVCRSRCCFPDTTSGRTVPQQLS